MWYSSTMIRTNEHAYLRIGKDIKTGKIPGLVVLHGEEQYLVDFYVSALVKKYVSEASKSLDFAELDRESLTVDEVIENLETVSILSERKVVVIRDFIDAKGRLPKNLEQKGSGSNALEAFLGYADNMPDGALLILTAAKQEDTRAASRRAYSALVGKIARNGSAYDFMPLNHGQLCGFIEKRFNMAGKAYRPAVVEGIIRECGYDNKNIDYGLYELDNDLKKVIAHSGTRREVTRDDIAGVITANPENDVFGMIDAIADQRKDRAMKLLHNLLADGESEYGILALLTRQLEIMLIVREMKDEGLPQKEIFGALAKSHNAKDFVVKNALRSSGRFTTLDLKRILSSAYAIDMNIKSGLYDGALAFEVFIAGI